MPQPLADGVLANNESWYARSPPGGLPLRLTLIMAAVWVGRPPLSTGIHFHAPAVMAPVFRLAFVSRLKILAIAKNIIHIHLHNRLFLISSHSRIQAE